MVTDKIKEVLIAALGDAIGIVSNDIEMSDSVKEVNKLEEIEADLYEALEWVESIESYNPERLH